MSTLSDTVKTVLPWIGTALGGPLGGLVAGMVGSKLGIPESTTSAITQILGGMSPEKLAELKQIETDAQIKLAELGYDSLYKIEELNTRVIEATNKTMQVEATAEHWPSYSWRPFIGAQFGFYIMSLWVLPLFHVTPVTLTPDTVMVLGAILGVASFFRGKAQADPAVQNTSQISQKG